MSEKNFEHRINQQQQTMELESKMAELKKQTEKEVAELNKKNNLESLIEKIQEDPKWQEMYLLAHHEEFLQALEMMQNMYSVTTTQTIFEYEFKKKLFLSRVFLFIKIIRFHC